MSNSHRSFCCAKSTPAASPNSRKSRRSLNYNTRHRSGAGNTLTEGSPLSCASVLYTSGKRRANFAEHLSSEPPGIPRDFHTFGDASLAPSSPAASLAIVSACRPVRCCKTQAIDFPPRFAPAFVLDRRSAYVPPVSRSGPLLATHGEDKNSDLRAFLAVSVRIVVCRKWTWVQQRRVRTTWITACKQSAPHAVRIFLLNLRGSPSSSGR